MLKVSQLNTLKKGKPILKKLSFEVQQGTIAVFLGGSGVGKTTLFRILNHLESYDSGFFELNGQALDLAEVSKRHIVGMVFQHFNLFEHLTVEENILLPLTKIQRKDKEEAFMIASKLLEKYGLHDKAKSSIHQLSGGQKQRLAIARTLALDPQVVCMDEPTSALDPLLTDQIAGYIQEIANGGRIVLVSTHDLQLVAKLDGVMFLMEAGSIVEKADIKSYYANPNGYPRFKVFFN